MLKIHNDTAVLTEAHGQTVMAHANSSNLLRQHQEALVTLKAAIDSFSNPPEHSKLTTTPGEGGAVGRDIDNLEGTAPDDNNSSPLQPPTTGTPLNLFASAAIEDGTGEAHPAVGFLGQVTRILLLYYCVCC